MNRAPAVDAARVDLPVSGMTCAACARLIERTLAKTPGVTRAAVNLASRTATVEYDPRRVRVGGFVETIEGLGYGVPDTETRPGAGEPDYRLRFLVAAGLAAPLMVLGMRMASP
jgi:P-type Cu+ transporter